ncbi:MAG: polyphosphate kinase 1 [Flavobacteriales bacterium]|nr:polyphosphate kinase 1 [Flavobacteriales bacterium]
MSRKNTRAKAKPSPLINREISWLSFNERVLQEAEDEKVPLVERIRFLGIFSNNLDEFFRVRVATLRRLVTLRKTDREELLAKPKKLLKDIQDMVLSQQQRFDSIYQNLIKQLKTHNIHLITETELDESQGSFVTDYFNTQVRPALIPVMLKQNRPLPYLRDRTIYLAIRLLDAKKQEQFALIELPTGVLPRFTVLPESKGRRYIILLDDVIRFCLNEIFSIFSFKSIDAYTIKLTRDAELDLDHDISKSFLEKMTRSIKQRKKGDPVRFVYDRNIPPSMLEYLKKRLKLSESDNLIPGGRYHNFKDFMKFPNVGGSELEYETLRPLRHPALVNAHSTMDVIRKHDVLLHFPYQSFNHMIDLLREAAIDPFVTSIKITTYRLAKNSHVINALVNAARNGKQVMVVMELQARFDEEANIRWSNKLEEDGVKVIFGMQGLKVHAKICLITRKEHGKLKQYATIGTGNFNEVTARVYTDNTLMTADKRITMEVAKVFNFLENNYQTFTAKHLMVSPFSTRKKLASLIQKEIVHSRKGGKGYIFLKLNNLVDEEMIKKLYHASQAGVKIRIIVRGTCSLIPGLPDISENIEVISIVDKFLEHTRIYVFGEGKHQQIFLSSADLMSRNLDFRVEVTCPIYDPKLQKQLLEMLDMQWADNIKSRYIDEKQENHYRNSEGKKAIRAQIDYYNYLQGLGK